MGRLTRQEYAAMLFLTISLAIGGVVSIYRQYRSDAAPDIVRPSAVRAIRIGDRPAPARPILPRAAAERPPAHPTSPRTPADSLVNLNTASAARLQTLPGIGPALARRIITYRTQAGALRTVDQLMDVKGIGAATLARLRARVRVDRLP